MEQSKIKLVKKNNKLYVINHFKEGDLVFKFKKKERKVNEKCSDSD